MGCDSTVPTRSGTGAGHGHHSPNSAFIILAKQFSAYSHQFENLVSHQFVELSPACDITVQMIEDVIHVGKNFQRDSDSPRQRSVGVFIHRFQPI